MTDEKKTGQTEEKATKESESKKKKTLLEADPETLHTTDPQEDMEGPISSIMQTIKEGGEASDVVSKEEANKKKDENT